MRFTVTTEGHNHLNLRQTLEEFANNLWIPDHFTPEQAEAFVMGCFRRTMHGEMELLELQTSVDDNRSAE